MEYITNFDNIKNKIKSEKEFIQNGGIIIETNPYCLDSIIKMMYSVYLYLDFYQENNLNSIKNYLNKMFQYAYIGKIFDYHAVNAAKLKIEEDYTEPLYYSETANIHNHNLMEDVFIGLSAISKSDKVISLLINYFDKGNI